MKKIFTLFSIVALLLTGCYSEDTPVGPGTPDNTAEAEISVKPETISTTLEGGVFELSIYSNASWAISCDQRDISFNTLTGAGNAIVLVTIPATTVARNFYIDFEASKMAVIGGESVLSQATTKVSVEQYASASVVGSWHIKSYCGRPSDTDIYMQFNEDGTFLLYQRSNSPTYTIYSGVYTADAKSSTLSGVYDDGTLWANSYSYSNNEYNELVLINTSNANEISIYEPSALPSISTLGITRLATKSDVKPL